MNAQPIALPWITPIVITRKREVPFDDREWVFELKNDGYRSVTRWNGQKCSFISKSQKSLDFKWFKPGLEDYLKSRDDIRDVIFDGEMVSQDASRRQIFSNMPSGANAYIAFDLLWLNGVDLQPLPLVTRRLMLESLIGPESRGCIQLSMMLREDGKSLFEIAQKNDLEGIIAKRRMSPYLPKVQWIKILNPNYSQKHRPESE